jgi:hypothetical protein
MRRHLILIWLSVLCLNTHSIWAGSESVLPPPVVEMPFDEIDPAATQAEVSRQVVAFVHTLDRHWGMNQDDLGDLVPGKLERQDSHALVFTRTVADHDVLEGYDFREGSLVRGRYVCLQRPVNGLNEFLDYYTAVKQSLTDAYGTPKEDMTVWENDLYQPLPDYWGIAVQMGHLHYAAIWDTADGTMSIELTGNHHSRLTIEYRSRAFVDPALTA